MSVIFLPLEAYKYRHALDITEAVIVECIGWIKRQEYVFIPSKEVICKCARGSKVRWKCHNSVHKLNLPY